MPRLKTKKSGPRNPRMMRVDDELSEMLVVLAFESHRNMTDTHKEFAGPGIREAFGKLPKALQQVALDRIAAAQEGKVS